MVPRNSGARGGGAGLLQQTPAVDIEQVRKTFAPGRNAVTALNDVSLRVEAGEFAVLLGPSGCGKTTLLRIVAGLERPDSGEVTVSGKRAFAARGRINLPPEHRQLSMVFQSYALWPHLSALSNVTFPLIRRGVRRREAVRRAEEILEMVRCGHLGNRMPTQLSGGQQQRIALARAIVAGQRLILFDEPLSNVDAKVREHLRADILTMQRELRFAALYVTHDQSEALMLADRVVVMSAGSVVQQGSPREIYERPTSRYVAEFVGSANLVKGVVQAQEAGGCVVSTALGKIHCLSSRGQSRPGPPFSGAAASGTTAHGCEVLAFFRPESCDLAPKGAMTAAVGPNRFAAVVSLVSYLGPMVEYTVQVGTEKVRALVPARSQSSRFAEGDSVELRIDPSDVQVLAEDTLSSTSQGLVGRNEGPASNQSGLAMAAAQLPPS